MLTTFPEINIPVVSIVWNYTGLSAQEVGQRIAAVNERSLTTTVNDIEHIESQSWQPPAPWHEAAPSDVVSSDLYPAIGLSAQAERGRTSANRPLAAYSTPNQSTVQNNFVLGPTVNYEADLFGRVRREVEGARATAQQAEADFENTRLILTAELVTDYFALRELDAEIQVVRHTTGSLPVIPVGLPSDLLQRRPDVASAERAMAAANARIGVARAAYYPSIFLGAGVGEPNAGWQSNALASLFSAPSRLWSIGLSATQTLFDAGKTRANVRIANADAGVKSAQDAFDIATARYKGGVDTYLEMITAEQTLLSDRRQAVQVHGQQFATAVYLVKALGGGWSEAGAAVKRAGTVPGV